MKWRGRQRSTNVEDRRRVSGRKVGGGIGCGTLIIILIALYLGVDPQPLVEQATTQSQMQRSPQGQTMEPRPDDELAELVTVTLKYTEDVWYEQFPRQLNRNYDPPVLVLFSGQDRSACGFASAATGPFYCPADEKLYIDLSFYQQLSQRFGASGDFAMAYVVAHEVAHHIQKKLGITDYVHKQRGRVSQKDYNQLSVRLELQADFIAGVWAHYANRKGVVDPGDFEEALRAANAIGDDRLQKQAQGYVVPDSFTHGTSEQRMRWFRKGLETGDLSQGDTFAATYL